MPFTTNTNHVQARQRLFGLRPYKITADVRHTKLSGEAVYLTAKKLSLYRDAQGLSWHCSHVACRHRVWESEEELELAHGDQGALIKNQEMHTYYAFGSLPEIKAQEAKPDKRDPKTGKVLEHGTRPVVARAAQDAVFSNAE